MPVRDSLFSLEVIVDQLMLSSVTCRFPAVAFRLLDFPTLLVEHVEPELADRIKKKISIEMQANLPRQLKELQDKNGAFLVKHGKSCLFKISIDTLQIHLTNTPLYVLVIDTFPETPKLVASCLIPLNECVDKIQSDIEKHGITVPHVHGEKGQFKLYNLMGIEVGHVDIACRLLSLGEGLMQHIPDHAIAKFGGDVLTDKGDSPRKSQAGTPRKPEVGSPSKADASPRKVKTPRHVVIKTPPKETDDKDLVVEDLEAPDKAQPIIISSAKEVVASVRKERELESSGTQTELPRKPKHVQFPPSDFYDELDNIYLTNTYCPPPLFYNSTAEEKLPPSKLEVYEYQSRPAHPLEVKDFDTESVRSDDVLFDLIEQGLDQTLIKPSKTEFIHYQHSLKPPPPKQPDLQQLLTSPNFQGGQFPFLRALTAELAFFQNVQAQGPGQSEGGGKGNVSPRKVTESSQQKGKSPRTPRTPHELQIHEVPPAEKENREHFLARLSTPKKKLPEKPGAVPSHKGWLRKEPAFGQRKTKSKFAYGMTNTQRLRLAQVNPELLHSLELEEEQVKLKKQQEQFDNMTNVQKAMAKTFVLKQAPIGRDEVVDSRTMVVPKPTHKRPVPTPRKVSIDENASIKEVSPTELLNDACFAQAQVPIDHPDTPVGRLDNLPEVEYDYEPSGSSGKQSGSSSQRSIQVHVPIAQVSESATYSSDEESRPTSQASKEEDDLVPVRDVPPPPHTNEKPPRYGQPRSTYPGFPATFQPTDTQTTAKTESTLHYTDDFEDSRAWMSTDEPELLALRDSDSESKNEGSESHTLTEETSDPTDDGVRTSTTIRIPIVNPKASLNSPKAAIKKPASVRAAESTARTLEGDSSSDKGSSSPLPKPRKSVTPTGDGSPQRMKRSVSFDEDDLAVGMVPPLYPRKGTKSDLAASVDSSQEKPTPRRRSNFSRSPSAEGTESPTRQRRALVKPKLESIHTESVSSYMPSDLELNMTYDSDDYSDDFDNSDGGYQPSYKPASEATVAKGSGRLGYTWN